MTGNRVALVVLVVIVRCFSGAIKNWRRERPGNETKTRANTETPNLVPRACAAVCGLGTKPFVHLWVKGQIYTCAVHHVGGEEGQKEMEPGPEEHLLEQR